MQHRGDADAGTEMLGVGGDRQLVSAETLVVDHGHVPVGNVGALRR
jgi:hypothetical protein